MTNAKPMRGLANAWKKVGPMQAGGGSPGSDKRKFVVARRAAAAFVFADISGHDALTDCLAPGNEHRPTATTVPTGASPFSEQIDVQVPAAFAAPYVLRDLTDFGFHAQRVGAGRRAAGQPDRGKDAHDVQ